MERLILQMSSLDYGFANEAVRQLRHKEYLVDGSLQKAALQRANLNKANLQGADLKNAEITTSE